MVPNDLITYFSTMATVGGTLVGLVFIAISIFPEMTVEAKAPLERQAKVASSFTALLNPLIISLFALIPHNTIGTVTLAVSITDLLTHIIISAYLLRQKLTTIAVIRNGAFVIGGLVLYIYELVDGIRLTLNPGDAGAMEALNILMIIIYIYGISRAWEVLGARQFHFTSWITDELLKQHKQHEENKSTNDLPRIPAQE